MNGIMPFLFKLFILKLYVLVMDVILSTTCFLPPNTYKRWLLWRLVGRTSLSWIFGKLTSVWIGTMGTEDIFCAFSNLHDRSCCTSSRVVWNSISVDVDWQWRWCTSFNKRVFHTGMPLSQTNPYTRCKSFNASWHSRGYEQKQSVRTGEIKTTRRRRRRI